MKNLNLKQLLLVITALLIINAPAILADDSEPRQSTTGPEPPEVVQERDIIRALGIPPIAPVVIGGVPDYTWRHGCGHTALGNVVGYYDGQGYGDLIAGDASTQTAAVDQAIASGGTSASPNPPGSEQHYEDFARPEDPPPGPLLTDDYITAGRTPHPNDCIADYMDTSKSTRNNRYGWSFDTDVGPSFVDYVKMQNPGYSPAYTRYRWGALTWSILTNEIDNNRPMVFLVDTDGNGGTDHFVTIVGYDLVTNQYGCHDTWAPAGVRWESFQGIASGNPWGIYSGITFQLAPTGQKWKQPPDESKNGIDIRCDRSDGIPRVLADDFKCDKTGPITKIVFWGSWKDDIKGQISNIHLSIHDDLPVNDPCNPYDYSAPGLERWSKDFGPNEFLETIHSTMEPEWFWDRATGQQPFPKSDKTIWKYAISIDPCQAFVQTEGKIYWLDVHVKLQPDDRNPEFGWKTTPPDYQWNDDAVWSSDDGAKWYELIYPSEHPYAGSIDLSFAIVTKEVQEPNNIKWSQPPVPTEPDKLYYGWNEMSEYGGNQIVADDWLCDNDDPVTDIHWWGSFKDWKGQDPPIMPSSFHITMWTDIPDPSPDNPDTFSHPNEVVWEIDCTNFSWTFVGWDYDPRTKCYEACFYFEQYLTEDEYFYQHRNPDGTPAVYWISIAAEYPAGTNPDNPWGWKTRPRMFNDDAVKMTPTSPHIGSKYIDGKPIFWPDPNKSWDMAFELTAQKVIQGIKWEQLPEPDPKGGPCFYGWDELSQYAGSQIVADDWACHTLEPVTDIHWWGSYQNYDGTDPPLDAPTSFHIAIWTDVPAIPEPYSHPLTVIWEWQVLRSELNEILVGCDEHPMIPDGRESCFYYEYKIPRSEWFYQEPMGEMTIYWLSIAAMYDQDPLFPWGWKTRPHNPDSLAPDDAVRISDPTAPKIGSDYVRGSPIEWQEDSYDTAFVLTTQQTGEVYVKWSQPPAPYVPPAYHGWNELSVYHCDHIAADDWFCNTDDPVSDIHWWGSYLGWSCEGEPPVVPESFHIAIWTDVPAGIDERFSHPGIVIWETDCNSFTCKFDGWDIDPRNPDAPPETCFKFEQDIPEEQWFYQKPGGNIYWISIAAKYPTGAEVQYPWGWKTRPRDINSRAPDDAVIISEPNAPTLGSPYVNGQPIWWPNEDDSWDLAFELTTKEKPPKPPVPNLKWSQPPIEINPVVQPVSYKLYATTFQAVDQLISIDPTTGAGTLIGNMTTSIPFGLTDRGTELWTFDRASDSNSMVRLDPATGSTLQKIVLNPPGLTGEGGVAFRSDGIGFLTSAMDIAGQLWSFDITVPSTKYIGTVSPSMDGLDFDGSNVLYGLEQASTIVADTYELYIIDQSTGATTLVGDTGVAVTGTVAGLTFAPDGKLFAALRDPLNPNTCSLYELDKGTGAATLIGPIGFSAISGLTALPVSDGPTLPIYCGWDEPSYLTQIIGEPNFMKVVADDYRCLGSMPVTSLHWWGSYIGWEGSVPPHPRPSSWLIGFWSNVSAGAVAPYSYPQELLWYIRVPEGRVKEEFVGRDEFPLNPDILPESCFQYYVDLQKDEIFWQDDFNDLTQDNIFWVSIVAVYPGTGQEPYLWGWKTRPWSWMDDAVTFNIDPPLLPGDRLHPDIISPIEYQGESYDVAFELDTDPNYIKWEQPFTGLRNWPHYEDEESMAREITTTEVVTKWAQQWDETEMGVDVDATFDPMMAYPPQLLADDFYCTTTEPITGINIYGSWWGDRLPRDLSGMENPAWVQFTLSFHDDIPIGPNPWSMPGDWKWWWTFGPGDFSVEQLPAMMQESYFMPCTGLFDPYDHMWVWKYSFDIDPAIAFLQEGTPDDPVIYWLDVQAQSLDVMQDERVRFGWKTSMEPPRIDDAAWAIAMEPYNGPWEELRHPMTGQSADLAFELTSNRVTTEFIIDRLVADDWKCERRTPVTAAVWWGSYIGYTYQACQTTTIVRPAKPDYFLLNIWTDVPAGADTEVPFSHPNEIIWEYRAYDYDEVLVGFDKHPLSTPGTDPLGREPVFRYSVRLPKDNWFLQKDVNDIYWFSVVAVYESGTDPQYDWGWTNHPHFFNDDAVAGSYDSAVGEWTWNELYDQLGNSEDMSFMLFTDPDECVSCADYNSDSIVNFIDYADFADDWNWSGLPGGYNNSDLNCNGVVDSNDLNIFTLQWLSSCP